MLDHQYSHLVGSSNHRHHSRVLDESSDGLLTQYAYHELKRPGLDTHLVLDLLSIFVSLAFLVFQAILSGREGLQQLDLQLLSLARLALQVELLELSCHRHLLHHHH